MRISPPTEVRGRHQRGYASASSGSPTPRSSDYTPTVRAGVVSALTLLVLGGAALVGIQSLGADSEREPAQGSTSVRDSPPRPIVLRTAFDADFESPTRDLWSAPQAREEGRVTLVRDVEGEPPRRGSMAARFEVRSGDSDVAGSGEGERAEVFLDELRTDAQSGTQWWAWSTYFPQDFEAPSGEWNVFTQFHNSGSDGQANVHFDVRDGEAIGLRVMGGDASSPSRRDFVLAPLERGRWYDFVFHVGWSAKDDGFVEVYVDGKLAVSKVHTPTLYDGQSVYLKQGYYRAAYERSSTVVYHDGARRLMEEESAGAAAAQDGVITLRQ